MAPSGHRRNLHHPRTGDSSSTYKFGRTKHCSVRYNIIYGIVEDAMY